ncbi:hypothetical protein PSTG_06285 [Puccinia striiformis f. sp. tritici PST-78]|uniref:Uncharacterized protein n=2 Tax=Puccinia striiformis f. sp. tritici TaxID=168172 RepID=A0A0L0VMV9_9BASI|nr:hypothetical protein PSTG_06285 [Puccinia striiformis f. sp. tritici PST-78]
MNICLDKIMYKVCNLVETPHNSDTPINSAKPTTPNYNSSLSNQSKTSDPYWTMTEPVMQWSVQTTQLLEATCDCSSIADVILLHRPKIVEKEVLTKDELEEKTKLSEKLQWGLVPLMQDQLNTFLLLLDLQNDWKNQTETKLESISEHLQKLRRTMEEIRVCLNSAEGNVKQVGTHDHHLKRCKHFTYDRMMAGVLNIMQYLYDMFWSCHDFVTQSTRSLHYPDDLHHQSSTLRDKSELLQRVGACNTAISKAIQRFEESDFHPIQDKWKGQIFTYNCHLESLTRLSRLTSSHSRDTGALQTHLIELAKFTIPLIKSVLILSKKISCRNTKILPVTLDKDLNSETLFKLHASADTIVT